MALYSCLSPPHCSHHLHPLDRSVFGPLKHYINNAADNWMRMNPGRTLTIYNIPSLVAKALPQAATASSIPSGFECTGIWPLNPVIFSETDFAPAFVTDRPAPAPSPMPVPAPSPAPSSSPMSAPSPAPAPLRHQQPSQSPFELHPHESAIPLDGRNSEVHHITGNYMWDQATLKEFSLGITDDSRLRMWWDGSEPLWVTMQKLQRNVYMYYWPGCEVDILGVRPAHCEEYFYYPSEKNFTDAIEDSLNALRIGVAKYLKIKPGLVATVCDSQTWKLCGNADMAAVYYETVDVMGHHYGPSSPQVKATIKGLDNTFQILNQRIKEKSLQNDLNVIIFSDHGMTDIQWMDKVIELQQYINMSDIVKMMDRGPVVSLWPKQSKVELIYRRLSAVENMKVYKRDEIPDRYYYKKGRFVSTLTLVADLGWFIIESKSMLPFWKNGTGEPQGWQSGWHGYDNELMDMRGFFLAQGPDFKKNLRAGPIRAVDVYNLMCHTVGIQALPNNGSWARVEFMLNPGRSGGRRSGGGQPTLTFSFLLGLLLLALLNGL